MLAMRAENPHPILTLGVKGEVQKHLMLSSFEAEFDNENRTNNQSLSSQTRYLMNLSKCLRVGGHEKSSAVNKMPRAAQIRGPQWILLAAALMLVVLGRSNQADAAIIHVNTTAQAVTNGKCSLQE